MMGSEKLYCPNLFSPGSPIRPAIHSSNHPSVQGKELWSQADHFLITLLSVPQFPHVCMGTVIVPWSVWRNRWNDAPNKLSTASDP